jgi:chromosome segregation ATPase
MNDSTHELVDCHVRVTPALARRIRKAAFSEQEGRDARSVLMIAAECDPDELESLRSQVNKLSDNIDEREQRLVTLKASAENCAADLSKVRKQLGERDDTIASLRKEQEEATARISALAETLIQSVEVRDLPTDFVDNVRTTIRAVRDGEDPRTAFLAAAKYDRDEVDSALSSVERAPLNVILKSGGFKAWVTRRILSV